MAVVTASGSKLYIGASVTKSAADTLAEFSAMSSWTEIGEVQNLGQIGDSANIVNFVSLSDGRVRKLKGARDAGTLALVCGRDPLDAGQVACVAAEATASEYAFKLVANDKPNASGTPTTHFFRGIVTSKQESYGAADDVVTVTFNVQVNSELFSDLAEAGV
jgi:hypothetical protein